MTTTLSRWGNSVAVRVPKSVLDATGLSLGDELQVEAMCAGVFMVKSSKAPHRRVKPESVTFSSLFSGWSGAIPKASEYVDDGLVGAELEAWER